MQIGRIQDGCHHQVKGEWMTLIQIDWLWVRFRRERESVLEWIWEKITRCLNPRWQCLNPTWQSSGWLPSSSWVRMNEWSFFCANGWNQSWQVWVSLRGKTKMAEYKIGRIQDNCHHQVESEWMSEVFFVQSGWIHDGRVQDSCHHQVEWEWMSLSQI